MFAYCGNNPVNAVDYTGNQICVCSDYDWGGYYGGSGSGIVSLWLLGRIINFFTSFPKPVSIATTPEAEAQTVPQSEAKAIAGSTPATPPDPNGNKGKKNQNSDIQTPDVKYPGNDPTQSPGDNYKWRGPDPQGGKRGGYVNVDGSDSWHPDLDHPDGVGPHWDYNDPFGHKWRVYPDWIEFVH